MHRDTETETERQRDRETETHTHTNTRRQRPHTLMPRLPGFPSRLDKEHGLHGLDVGANNGGEDVHQRRVAHGVPQRRRQLVRVVERQVLGNDGVVGLVVSVFLQPGNPTAVLSARHTHHLRLELLHVFRRQRVFHHQRAVPVIRGRPLRALRLRRRRVVPAPRRGAVAAACLTALPPPHVADGVADGRCRAAAGNSTHNSPVHVWHTHCRPRGGQSGATCRHTVQGATGACCDHDE